MNNNPHYMLIYNILFCLNPYRCKSNYQMQMNPNPVYGTPSTRSTSRWSKITIQNPKKRHRKITKKRSFQRARTIPYGAGMLRFLNPHRMLFSVSLMQTRYTSRDERFWFSPRKPTLPLLVRNQNGPISGVVSKVCSGCVAWRLCLW